MIKKYKPFVIKLIISFITLSTISTFISTFLLYKISQKIQSDNIKNKIISTAKIGASFLDGDEFEKLTKSGNADSPEYQRIKEILNKLKKEQNNIKYIYSMAKTEKKGILQFIVDPEDPIDENKNGIIEENEKPADFGELYNAEKIDPSMFEGFKKPTISNIISYDKWGAFLSGYAPILNSKKEVVGIVGVDITAEYISYFEKCFFYKFIGILTLVILCSILFSILFSTNINKPLKKIHIGIKEIANGNFNVQTDIKTNDEFEILGNSFNEMAKALREKELIKNVFLHYFPKQVANEILKHPEDILLKSQKRKVTILFSDLTGFTTFSEFLPPEKIIEILNVYFSRMIDIIFKYEGVIHKFLGDGMMILFGTPINMPNQEERAVRTALEMQKEIKKLALHNSNFYNFKLRIGINTGIVVVGNIGSEKRMDYTVIGEEVNITSKLEKYNKELNSEILISSSTYQPIKHLFKTEEIKNISIKGIKEKFTVYVVKN